MKSHNDFSRPLVFATRSSAQGNCSAKSLAGSVMSSILPCSSILSCPPCLPPVMLSMGGCPASGRGGVQQGEGSLAGGGGGGSGRGGGGQGTFQSSCHNCTTTWCFALKGLRTNRTRRRRTRRICLTSVSDEFNPSRVQRSFSCAFSHRKVPSSGTPSLSSRASSSSGASNRPALRHRVSRG